jgi:hypothetical protein
MKEIPELIKYGIFMFPVIIIISLLIGIFSIVFNHGPGFFLWLVIPSIIFEEIFESWAYDFSNNIIANFSFAVLFWFFIGALGGYFKNWLRE